MNYGVKEKKQESESKIPQSTQEGVVVVFPKKEATHKNANNFEQPLSETALWENVKNSDMEDTDPVSELMEDEQQSSIEDMGMLEDAAKAKNFPVYKKLFKEEIYEDIFQKLEKDYFNIKNTTVRKKYLKEALKFIFHAENLIALSENKRLIFLSKEIVKQLRYSTFLKSVGVINNIQFYFQPLKFKLIFSDLLLNKDLEGAKFILNFFEPDMADFKKTVLAIQKSNDIQLLRFFCENVPNLQFNNGEILRKAALMDFAAAQMLIDEFKFDVTSEDEISGESMLQIIIEAGRTKTFEGLVKNYVEQINVLQLMQGNAATKISMIDLIKQKCNIVKQYEFLSILLKQEHYVNIPKVAMKQISGMLFEQEFINKFYGSNIYSDFFQQKEFYPEDINYGQRHFLYGIISHMWVALKEANSHDREDVAEKYSYIMKSFLECTKEVEMPTFINHHIVGVAVVLASLYPETSQILKLILNKFPQYINVQNPNGTLPIDCIEKNSEGYTMLIKHGAMTIERKIKNGVVAKFLNIFKGKHPFWKPTINKQEKQGAVDDGAVLENTTCGATNWLEMLNKIKTDFIQINHTLSNIEADLELKTESENLYFKAIGLIKTLQDSGISKHIYYEEIHFLNQNFSNYLKKSVEKYVELLRMQKKQANKPADERLQESRGICLQQIFLLQKQVDVFTENLLSNVINEKISSQKVHQRFLEEKFPTT